MPPSLTRFHSPSGPGDRTRASALQAAIASAPTVAVGWIDPAHALPDTVLAALCDALEGADVAAATMAGAGRTVTAFGVPAAPAADPAPVPGSRPSTAPREVLYGPAGLVVFHRARVLAAGGVDTALVFGHEDANLGWRLALRGLRTVEVTPGRGAAPFIVPGTPSDPRASSTPRGPRPTADCIEAVRRLRHETTNQLVTLFLCAGDEWLRACLPAALARVLCLAAHDAGLRPDQFDFGARVPPTLPLPVETMARLLAIDDLVRHIPHLRKRRAELQAARRVDDDRIRPLLAGDPVDRAWEEAAGDGARALCRMLGCLTETRVAVPHTARQTAAAAAAATDCPHVSIVILTALGPRHLPECLDSLAALDYPRESIEVIVVDNGSAEDPTATVHRHYPGAHVLCNGRNLGFCGGNNAGVRAASHGWIFFLNDDTRVHPGALRALFATAARHHATAVGAFVVDWTGDTVDFAGGGVSFDAHGFQDGFGSRDVDRWKHERAIPFANGAAMLVRRDAYVAAGGFPDPYFAYYEDVALGWALWLQGGEVWLCPDGIVHHRHHGTSAGLASASRQRNCERNACFTVLTLASDDALPDLLAATLLLAGERVVMGAGLGGVVDDRLALVDDHRLPLAERLDPRLYLGLVRAELRRRGARRELGAIGSLLRVGVRGLLGTWRPLYVLARWGGAVAPPVADAVNVPAEWAATLAAVAEWCSRAGEMEPIRHAIQAGRREDDRAFASRFPAHWLDAIPVEPARQAEYESAHRAVVAQFALERFAQPV